MKEEKDSKPNRLDSKKMSTSKAIASALKKKKPKKKAKLPKSLGKPDGGASIVNDINQLGYAADLKSVMTDKELKFLEIYLVGNITQVNALKSAGYEGYTDGSLEVIGSRIIRKHETQTEDARIIARAMGLGEFRVLRVLWDLMQSKNERIRLDATMYLGKILGLTREQVEGAQGITIIFEGQTPSLPASVALPAQAGAQGQAPAYAGKVLQITK